MPLRRFKLFAEVQSMDILADDILNFWFVESSSENWFKKDPEFDQRVASRYSTLIDVLAGEVDENGVSPWEGAPRGDLASVIVLDQFPRNVYRNSVQAFAFDEKAFDLVKRALERKSDEELPDSQRSFLFMPLMHSESLEAQNLSVECFGSRMESRSNMKWAIEHREIIEKFGRFPHRNVLLGRTSTKEEIDFLEAGGFSG
jgi:uncharacterized protein (DUF924 family)